jgi:ABC-type Fe3+ transport system substrate-binding protein
MRRLLPLLLILSLGCGRWGGDPGPDADGPKGELVVVTDLSAVDQAALKAVLSEGLKGIQPRFVTPGAPVPADLFLLGNPSLLEGAVGFAVLPTAALPAELVGPEARYVGIDRRAQVLAVGRLMANVPTGILDLGEPRFSGRLARPPTRSEDLVLLISSVMADRGAPVGGRVLEGLVSNAGPGSTTHDADAALDALLDKSVDLAMTDHTSARRKALGDEPPDASADIEQALSEARFVTVYPDADASGVAWSSTILARPEGAPHPASADAAIAWLLGVEGQSAWSKATGAYPALSDATPAAGLRAEGTFAWSRTSLTERAELRAQVVQLLLSAPLDVAPSDDEPEPDAPPDPEASPPPGADASPAPAAPPAGD